MILLWKKSRYDNPGIVITEENAHEYQHAEADFGKFRLNIVAGRLYKDGTRQFMARVLIHGDAFTEATLVRVRGHLLDAIRATERALFRYYNDYRQYRLPVACVDIDPAAKQLLQRRALCFECDCETCALNPDGICMHPVLYGGAPDLGEDGCSGFLLREESHT